MLKIFLPALALLLAACGSYKAVRPDAPRAVVLETQSYAVKYKAARGQRITAVYHNNSSPLTVELRQGHTAEKLKQIQTWAKGVEYANPKTRWHVQEGFATLTRGKKVIVFTEVAE
ncbi:hypothetical protein [Neisseria chenwenguii]|uniref:Uncharacterized protein n=1 Tax=Neisseria chenwenguii TaxID=1853278 RepID=A0A220S2U6_9NEIS|nr:hypothetical protein [Neisseria chenwenguii]ASK27708.1 hypothetical protein BG910_08125 [Neisseria chenwenguii]ROV55674.1 hypothetical protein EGS38_08225 [Neisseria chenwenguii]